MECAASTVRCCSFRGALRVRWTHSADRSVDLGMCPNIHFKTVAHKKQIALFDMILFEQSGVNIRSNFGHDTNVRKTVIPLNICFSLVVVTKMARIVARTIENGANPGEGRKRLSF